MGIGGKGIFGYPKDGIFTSITVGDGNITNVGDIALDTISADGADIGITLGAADALLIGNTTAVQTLTSVTVSTAKLQHADIDSGTAAGDLVHIISGTGATAGYYRITAVGTNEVDLATAPGGSGTNIVCNIYKDVILVQATDGTDGQRICGYSHQDKPLVIGGDLAGAGVNIPATSNSLGGEDVLIGGILEVDGACFLDDDVTLGAAKHLVLPLHDDAATPTLAFGDEDSGFYESSDDNIKISIAGTNIWNIDGSYFRSLTTAGGALVNDSATSTFPTHIFTDDGDTGLGKATMDQLSLIAGGVEGQRITEASRTIESNATVGEDDGGDLRIVTTADHGLKVDDVVQFAAGTGALCTGISASTNYYVTQVDTVKKFNLATSRGGTNITYTDTGTAFTSYELEITINNYGQVYSDISVYIPAVEFDVTTGNAGDINTTGTHGHSMTDGELSTLSYKPIEALGLDVSRPINVQVVWCPIDGTTANGVTWLVTYDHDAFESGVLTAPATALDTVIAEDNENDTPYVIQKTEKGVINAATLTATNAIAFRVEADVVDSGNDPGCWFMGLLLSQ